MLRFCIFYSLSVSSMEREETGCHNLAGGRRLFYAILLYMSRERGFRFVCFSEGVLSGQDRPFRPLPKSESNVSTLLTLRSDLTNVSTV